MKEATLCCVIIIAQIDVYDHDGGGSHDLIGSCVTDLATLAGAAGIKTPFPLINEKKRAKKKSYKDSGEIFVKGFSKERQITFLDYVQVWKEAKVKTLPLISKRLL